MPNGNAGLHIKIYFTEFSLYVSFIYSFREFNHVAITNKRKTLIFIVTAIQKFQFEIPFSIYKFTFQNSVSTYVSYFASV